MSRRLGSQSQNDRFGIDRMPKGEDQKDSQRNESGKKLVQIIYEFSGLDVQFHHITILQGMVALHHLAIKNTFAPDLGNF